MHPLHDITGLNLPQKRNFSNFISKLPFTSSEPDATMLIERKQGLEKYLQVRWVWSSNGGWGLAMVDVV